LGSAIRKADVVDVLDVVQKFTDFEAESEFEAETGILVFLLHPQASCRIAPNRQTQARITQTHNNSDPQQLRPATTQTRNNSDPQQLRPATTQTRNNSEP